MSCRPYKSYAQKIKKARGFLWTRDMAFRMIQSIHMASIQVSLLQK